MKTLPMLAGLVSVLALATAPVLAAPMEIEDLAKIKSAGNLTVAPDGQTIAFTVSKYPDLHAGDEDGFSKSQLYIKRTGAEAVLFTSGENSVSRPHFSPDGDTVYFLTRRGEDKHNALYSLSLSGGEATKVFQHETGIGDYAISPNGQTLYFVATEKDEDKSKLSKKGFDAYAYEEDQTLAALWTVSLDAEDAKADTLFTDKHVTGVELSSDGRSLVVAAVPTALVDDSLMKTRLHVLDAASGRLRAEVATPGKLGSFVISPDNQRIAFQAGTDIHDTSTGVLMLANMSDGSFRQLTPDALQHITDVEWLDNDSILANAHRGVESALVSYSLSGDEERIFATPADVVVRNVEVGQGGKLFFTADSPKHPSEVFKAEGGAVQKLTDNNGWLADIDLAPQTTFTFTARDGREIQGLLITPTGTQPANGWPLIMTVHGGPEAHDSDGWLTAYSRPGQFGAGDGYAVFYPNYRGSTARGVAFAKEHQNDYAGAEFNDLTDAVDALVAAGIADKDRVGITGGSYGGYASMWGATAQTDHFAAAVPFVGISNQVSKFGTSDIPNEMHLVHSLKWPWEDNWMNLIERSPIFHAGKSTTPTLIMHGERDTRVHPSQSMELYRSMKVRTDTPVRLVFYPREGHGNRRAAARTDYAYRLMRWMDTYLAEGATRNDPMPEFDLNLSEKLGWDKKDDDE
ncbi:S9 family peptidase [Algimonas porphyrae]|uniref:Peptidase S9 n=1 Tax=Algimonas porphyrae TaxID=1128113 RepID=A0ABQ5V3P4_9PROT|nr:S9 family peptidase [Algimonas porphyrae]GLQ21672.1 peptidase S9 [Algimonas porphyrae]